MQTETTESLLALSRQQNPVVIIGGGPAGLSAAYELSNAGVRATVLEGSKVVGGISRTVEYKGYLFDIGGHRFFTKVKLVRKMWEQISWVRISTQSSADVAYFFTRTRFSRIPWSR